MRYQQFSLVEIIIATFILAMCAVTTTSALIRSHVATSNATESWQQNHLLAMGCEYFLLFGHEAPIPEDMLPEEYEIRCKLENIKDASATGHSGWGLGRYKVTLFYQGIEAATMEVDKIVASHRLTPNT